MTTANTAQLYLIPTPLGEGRSEAIFPNNNTLIIQKLKYFVVENERTARRFLKYIDKSIDIDSLHFEVLDKRTQYQAYSSYLNPIEKGESIGLLSEAGCPGVADPGAELVRLAHQKNIKVTPLIGPSSILLAQMASGLNGQSFAFNGYIPIKGNEGVKMIQKLEKRSMTEHQSQIFIEAPYRNRQLLELFSKILSPNTLLCIASGINTEQEYISTKSIKQWKGHFPDIHKVPSIFIFLAQK